MKCHWFIWIPRIVMILVVLFMGMFSLDVFSSKAGLGMQLAGFLIHNIPALLLLLTLILTWKRPAVAGYIFLVLGVALSLLFYVYFNRFFLFDFTFFSLPVLICAYLFLLARTSKEKMLPVLLSTTGLAVMLAAFGFFIFLLTPALNLAHDIRLGLLLLGSEVGGLLLVCAGYALSMLVDTHKALQAR